MKNKHNSQLKQMDTDKTYYQTQTWSEIGLCKHDRSCKNKHCLFGHTPLDKCIFGDKCTNRCCMYAHPVKVYRGMLLRDHCKSCYVHGTCVHDDGSHAFGYLSRRETKSGILYSLIQPMGN